MQQQIGWRIIWRALGLALGMGIAIMLAACAPNGAGTNTAGAVNGTAAPSPTCPAGQTGHLCASPPHSTGTLSGTVVAGPTCPVEPAEQPCPPRPVPDRLVLIETPDGTVVARATTDQQGRFVLTLPPGTYTLLVPPDGNPFPIQRTSQQVTLVAGQTAQVTVELDTGIR